METIMEDRKRMVEEAQVPMTEITPMPHRHRGIVDYIPKGRHFVTEYKLVFQIIAMVILMIATQHDQHLADTLYALELDFFGDAITLPRNLLNIPAAAVGGLSYGGGA